MGHSRRSIGTSAFPQAYLKQSRPTRKVRHRAGLQLLANPDV